jgi:hypothetical protein
MNLLETPVAFEDDVLDMFEETNALKCLLPRYASIKRFVSGYGRAYAVHGGLFENPQYTHGLTTWLSMSSDCRDEKAIDGFIKKHGIDSDRVLNELADFGTFGHIKTGELFTFGKVLTGQRFTDELRLYMLDKGMPMHKLDKYADLMAMYLYSMSCFAHETNFECYAVEYPVCDFTKKITTCIDLIGEMDDAKTGERINVCINLKFRDNPACYEKDEAQTNIEKFILEDLVSYGFCKMPKERQIIDKCFILCPKKITSRTRDNYALFDTTNKYSREEYYHAQTTREISKKKPLEVKLDAFIPQYRNAVIQIGQAPQYYTLRQRLENMFL